MADKTISIPGVQVKTLRISIEGETPMLCNKFSKAAMEKILDKQMKKPRGAMAAKDPDVNYHGSIYQSDEGWYGFPASGIKRACVDACRFIDDLPMTEARGAFFVIPQGMDAETFQQLVMLEGDPEVHQAMVRLRGSTADVRFRAMFRQWTISFDVRYNPNVITEEGIVNLLETAGFHIGLGDWRPAKNGTFGMFHVKRG